MIEMKQSHLARADWGSCCGNICGLVCLFEAEIEMLQSVLEAMQGNDGTKAVALLEDYVTFLNKNYESEYHIC